MNIIKNNSVLNKPSGNYTYQNKKQNNKTYNDPLKKWPIKGLAYSNELGAVVSGISPKLGTALWVPSLMYFGADIYDKYKNDETSYKPSKRRGVKEAVFQAMASVVLPTAAVATGQRAISSLNRITKTGLSTQSKIDVIGKSLNYMEANSLHTFAQKPKEYAQSFKEAIITTAKDAKGEFKTMPALKKILTLINPLKDADSIAFAKEQKLGDFAQKQAERIMSMREQLMQNQKPKQMSKKLFGKFQKIQGEYSKIYPEDKYLGKAAKSILKEYHADQIFKNKLIKTAGGFVALALLAKPIDRFVENIVIKKTVEPGLDFLSNGYNTTMNNFNKKIQKRNEQKLSARNTSELS
jgi:hypothetical protein